MRFHHFLVPLLALPFLLIGCGSTASVDPSQSSSAAISQQSQDVVVTEPAPGATVTSPLTVTGEARGTWYFEASFPVKLLDDKDNLLTVLPAQAQGEWMTTDFVPFSVTLTFETDAPSGFLVLEKDNPSGLPEHAAEVRIPVQFGK